MTSMGNGTTCSFPTPRVLHHDRQAMCGRESGKVISSSLLRTR
ncbi:hypothetical protein STIAU_2371, partial [Stigmatella aurantiaca DW4/3-1]